jgi:hypothetical protein
MTYEGGLRHQTKRGLGEPIAAAPFSQADAF